MVVDKNNIDRWLNDKQKDILFHNIMNTYLLMHKKLQKSLPYGFSLVIGGGAIRDLFLKKEITDLDFFVMVNKDNCAALEKDLSPFMIDKLGSDYFANRNLIAPDPAKKFFAEVKFYQNILHSEWNKDYDISIPKNSAYFGFSNTGMLKIDNFHGLPVDLIFIKRRFELFMKDSFDFDICKIYFVMNSKTEGWSINLSDEFLMDAMNKKITFNADCYTEDQIMHSFKQHLPRIAAKYNDFEINCVESPSFVKENGLIIFQDTCLNKSIKLNNNELFNKKNKI